MSGEWNDVRGVNEREEGSLGKHLIGSKNSICSPTFTTNIALFLSLHHLYNSRALRRNRGTIPGPAIIASLLATLGLSIDLP